MNKMVQIYICNFVKQKADIYQKTFSTWTFDFESLNIFIFQPHIKLSSEKSDVRFRSFSQNGFTRNSEYNSSKNDSNDSDFSSVPSSNLPVEHNHPYQVSETPSSLTSSPSSGNGHPPYQTHKPPGKDFIALQISEITLISIL